MPKSEMQSVLLASFLVIFIHVQVWELQEYGNGKSDSLYEKKENESHEIYHHMKKWILG